MLQKLHKQRLLAISGHLIGTPCYNAVWMESLSDQKAWEGTIVDVNAACIRESGKPLVEFTSDDNIVGPSCTMKDEPADLHGKNDLTDDDDTTTSSTTTVVATAVASRF
jgi:hypothetical protein